MLVSDAACATQAPRLAFASDWSASGPLILPLLCGSCRRLVGGSLPGAALTEEGMGLSYQAFCIAQRGLAPWPFGAVEEGEGEDGAEGGEQEAPQQPEQQQQRENQQQQGLGGGGTQQQSSEPKQ